MADEQTYSLMALEPASLRLLAGALAGLAAGAVLSLRGHRRADSLLLCGLVFLVAGLGYQLAYVWLANGSVLNSATFPPILVGTGLVAATGVALWFSRPTLRRSKVLLGVVTVTLVALAILVAFLVLFLWTLSSLDMRDF
jgi:disulfide bond formation protein DsbB